MRSKRPDLIHIQKELENARDNALKFTQDERDKMRGAIVFREEKVKGEEVTSVKGLSSEMANIDHLMLLAYHSRKVDINLDRMDTLAQGVGRYPLVYPITKSRSAELEKK